MSIPVIAATLGAFLIMLQTLLMLNVGFHRAQTSAFIGMGNDLNLERKVRQHGNLVENAALFVLVLALAELCGLPANVLFWFAVVFGLARVSHVLAFTSLSGSHEPKQKIFPVMRVLGSFGTAASAIGLGGYLAYALTLL